MPRKNVAIRLSSITCSHIRPYEDSDDLKTKTFIDDLKGWAKISNELYIWHYSIGFSHYAMPFPDFKEMADSIRLFQHNSVQGILVEGSWNSEGGSDADLRSYYTAKLLWNPDQDAPAPDR